MRISRQAAQQLAIAGERAGDIELLQNPDDRRIRQLELTRKGKAELERSRSRKRTWVAVLLNGLGRHQMHATTHILRVIRHRLLRDERQRVVTGRRMAPSPPFGNNPLGAGRSSQTYPD
jgi:DNA-binding MarR family transcriptional regulator